MRCSFVRPLARWWILLWTLCPASALAVPERPVPDDDATEPAKVVAGAPGAPIATSDTTWIADWTFDVPSGACTDAGWVKDTAKKVGVLGPLSATSSRSSAMALRHRIERRISVVYLPERIYEEPVVTETQDALQEFVKDGSLDGILVSFQEVTRLASSGLGLMIWIYQQLHDRGARLGICGLADRHRRMFQMTRLDEFLDFYASEEAALAAMRSPDRDSKVIEPLSRSPQEEEGRGRKRPSGTKPRRR